MWGLWVCRCEVKIKELGVAGRLLGVWREEVSFSAMLGSGRLEIWYYFQAALSPAAAGPLLWSLAACLSFPQRALKYF